MSRLNLSIRHAGLADEGSWNRFVEGHPQGSPFHLTGWSRAVGEGLGHHARHLIAIEDGRVRGVMPLIMVRSSLTGCRMVSTPLAGYGGPLADDPTVADALVGRARRLTREVSADHLELHFEREDRVPQAARSLPTGALHCTFREELPDDPADVIGWIPRKTRRMVRLGVKAGLAGRAHRIERESAATGRTPGWLVRAHGLVAATMRDLGTPSYSVRMLRQLLAEDPARWFVWAVYTPNGAMAAAVWVARFGDCLYPHFSGADVAHRKVGVNNFLYSSLMEAGIAEGARAFDFGRSKVDSGPYHFKRHFGFEPRELGYRYDLVRGGDLPSLSPASSRYAMAIRLWQRLPLPVTRTLGPALVSHFV